MFCQVRYVMSGVHLQKDILTNLNIDFLKSKLMADKISDFYICGYG